MNKLQKIKQLQNLLTELSDEIALECAVADPLQTRRLCLESFHFFVKNAWKHAFGSEMVDAFHMDAICYHLEHLWNSESCDTLIINIPPGHGLSSIVSVLFPVWVALKEPSENQLVQGFSQSLCNRDWMQSYKLSKSGWFENVFGEGVLEQKGRRTIEFKGGGERRSQSVSRNLMEFQAKLIVVDSPYGIGLSSTEKEFVDEVIQKQFCKQDSSQNPSKRVLCGQRAGIDDCFSDVMKTSRDTTIHLSLPMEFNECCVTDNPIKYSKELNGQVVEHTGWRDRREAGEVLWSSMMTGKRLKKLKQALRSKERVSAMLQQSPIVKSCT